tara:strand:+ start:3129 stop:3377 length:249 start_codon:yes stop_codon:yes gene_type:complete
MTNKNPYELRYEIYQQASQRLSDIFHNDNMQWQDFDCWKREQEADGNTVTAIPPVSVRPVFPTHEEILIEAEKIYDFVQQKS